MLPTRRVDRGLRAAFSLVELLVVIAILAMLIAVLLPAVQSAREAARLTACKNNLRQISLATLQFHETVEAFPPARLTFRPDDPSSYCGGGEPSWMVRILPFLERSASAGRWNVNRPFAEHPESLRLEAVGVYVCPTRRSADQAVSQAEYALEFPLAGPSASAHTAAGSSPLAWCPLCGPGRDNLPLPRPKEPRQPQPQRDPSGEPEQPDPANNDVPEGLIQVTYARGALGDYAGNHGDPNPSFAGLASDFYFGGNGTGVLISSRPVCGAAGPMDWRDRVQMKHLVDGASKTFLVGERHVARSAVGIPPLDGPIFDGSHLPSIGSVAGPGFPLTSDRTSAEVASSYRFGSAHRGLCQFAMADGSVHSMPLDSDERVLARLANRDDRRLNSAR